MYNFLSVHRLYMCHIELPVKVTMVMGCYVPISRVTGESVSRVIKS